MRTNLLRESSSDTMFIRDWRTALRSPPTYRLGNRTFRFNFHFAMMILCFGSLAVIFFYIKTGSSSSSDVSWLNRKSIAVTGDFYNSTYPLTPPILLRGMQTYRIGMISDLDTSSKSKTESQVWKSFFMKGYLSYTPSKDLVTITWDPNSPIELDSSFSLKGRGMELSELVIFNGRLLTFDDRTGLIYEIFQDKIIPWIILMDGDGHSPKGFKSEWATVKDKTLYVGSMGKEWTTAQGDYQNEDPMYVKAVSPSGEVKNVNWSFNYKVLREEALGITWPGYMIHESGMWSEKHQKWFFLPRRCSKERYNETRDEHMGCNILITADELFSKIETTKIGRLKPTHGYSSFKFIPGTDDNVIVAIKTEEVNGKTATYISAFTINGKIMLDEKIPTDLKYEGIEFI